MCVYVHVCMCVCVYVCMCGMSMLVCCVYVNVCDSLCACPFIFMLLPLICIRNWSESPNSVANVSLLESVRRSSTSHSS